MRETPLQDNVLAAGWRSLGRGVATAAPLLLAVLATTACTDSQPVALEREEAAPAPLAQVRQGTFVKPSLVRLPAGVFAVEAMSNGLVTEDLSGGLTPQDLAEALVGEGVTVSNVSYTGVAPAAGIFSGGEGIIGFEGGVILSTGTIASVRGPNLFSDVSENHGASGDAALTTLAGFPTFDAAILTFDFVPDAGRIFFQYVFASEEYNEYVNSEFNDVFAFWVNGVNCAVVGNGDPVSINSINAGWPIGQNASNPELYINNDPHDGGVASGNLLDTEMDGLTVVLTCEAAVNPGATNTMRLAIADVSDAILDSNVFIKAGSLTTTPPGDDPPPPPPSDDCEACSAGFWGQNGVRSGAYPAGYAPAHLVSSVFPEAEGYLGEATLLQALQGYPQNRGRRDQLNGAKEILLRQAVAAILNEAKFGAAYPAESVASIRTSVAGALASGDRSTILALAEAYDLWNNNLKMDPATGEMVQVGSCPL